MEDVDPSIADDPGRQDHEPAQGVVGNVPVSAHCPGVGGRADEAEEDLFAMPHPRGQESSITVRTHAKR